MILSELGCWELIDEKQISKLENMPALKSEPVET